MTPRAATSAATSQQITEPKTWRIPSAQIARLVERLKEAGYEELAPRQGEQHRLAKLEQIDGRFSDLVLVMIAADGRVTTGGKAARVAEALVDRLVRQ